MDTMIQFCDIVRQKRSAIRTLQIYYLFVIKQAVVQIFVTKWCYYYNLLFLGMDASLQKRIDEIRRLKEEFGLDQQRIADNTEPARTRVTVARVLSGQDERYLTESNVAAIEKGIKKILAEYRKKLRK